MIEKSEGWCCSKCGRLIKGDCENDKGTITCIGGCMEDLPSENKRFQDLKEENTKLRDCLNGYLPIGNVENHRCWKLINQIIENEIEQETFCNI